MESSPLQCPVSKSKLGAILPEQITTNFTTVDKTADFNEAYDQKMSQEKEECEVRKRKNLKSGKGNDQHNLPTAEKLIKPDGAKEHANKMSSKNVMSEHAVNLR